MNKITFSKKAFIITAIIIGIFACLSQDENILKGISALFILFVIFLMTKNLEKMGLRSLFFTAGPVLLKYINTVLPLSGTKWVAFVTDKVNVVLTLLGISAQMDEKACFSIIFYAFFAIVLLVMNKTDNTAMGTSTKKVDPDRMRQTQALCGTLKNRLAALNREEDWNDNNFVPIEAQVEMMVNGKHKRRHADLLACLKHNRSFFSVRKLWNKFRHEPQKTVFLVLGDPGSGKSVALRKLCIDLMDETKTTNKIPVYINLKKWNREWTISNLPKTQDLIDFIKSTLQGENPDSFTDSFLDNYFQDMLDNGQWYFIFDSFDELPCLMGAGNNRELVKRISELLHDFLVSGKQNGGIIASRYYRAPSEELEAEVTLQIREFDDVRIKKMLHIYLKQAYDVIDVLFRKREDLVVLCRNPFYLSLLISHIQIWGTQLPSNQMELYDKFLKGRLEKHKGILDDAELKEEDVFRAAEKMALLMQESTDYGLECPVKEIHEKMGGMELCDKYLNILEYIRLCRRGGNKDTISFVHRRFQEYLLAKSIRDNKIKIDNTECICFNSGLRDALALYCEVAEETKAKEIAWYCWNVVQNNISCKDTLDKPGSMILVNTLYFMVDAFRTRKDAIADFKQEFETLIEMNLTNKTHYIIQLAMANSIALFDQESDNLPKTVLNIFKLKNHYLNDMVMHNCRLIKRIDNNVEKEFIKHINSQGVWTLLRRFSNTDFALSKAKGFGYVRFVHSMCLVKYVTILLAVLVMIVFMTIYGINNTIVFLFTKDIKGNFFLEGISLFMGMLAGMIFTLSRNKIRVWEIGFFALALLFCETLYKNSIKPIALIVNILVLLAATCELASVIHILLYVIRENCTVMLIGLGFEVILGGLIYCVFKFINTEVLMWILLGISLLLVLYALFGLLRYTCRNISDRVQMSHNTFSLRVNRTELANKYDKLHTKKWKLIYLNRLLENHAQLEGDWPSSWKYDEERKKLKNEDLERTLAMLEYENVRTENQSYNTVI